MRALTIICLFPVCPSPNTPPATSRCIVCMNHSYRFGQQTGPPSSDGSNELFKRGMISKPSIEMGQCQSSLASQIYNRVSTLKNSLIIQCSAQFRCHKTIRFYIPVFCIGLPRMEMLSQSSNHPNVLNHLLLHFVIINVTSSISFC